MHSNIYSTTCEKAVDVLLAVRVNILRCKFDKKCSCFTKNMMSVRQNVQLFYKKNMMNVRQNAL